MENEVAVKKLLEFYAIPPQHNSQHKGDSNIVKSIEGAFGLPLVEVEKKLRFDQVRNAYDNHMRRVGKELTAVVKQICR